MLYLPIQVLFLIEQECVTWHVSKCTKQNALNQVAKYLDLHVFKSCTLTQWETFVPVSGSESIFLWACPKNFSIIEGVGGKRHIWQFWAFFALKGSCKKGARRFWGIFNFFLRDQVIFSFNLLFVLFLSWKEKQNLMIGLVIGNSRALFPLSEGWGSHNSGPLSWVSYILGLDFKTCLFQYCSLLASSPCMASEASWRDRKSEWRSREGRTNLSHPSHSHLLLRAAIVWLLATPPNGELVHRLLVLRGKPREM